MILKLETTGSLEFCVISRCESCRTPQLVFKIFRKRATFFSCQWIGLLSRSVRHKSSGFWNSSCEGMLLFSALIHRCSFTGEAGDEKCEITRWHTDSRDTYRIRLNDSEEYRFFAAPVREENKHIYEMHRAQTLNCDCCSLEMKCMTCWRMFLGLLGHSK